MAMALTYALGRLTSLPTPSIAATVRLHGLVNALAFVCLGLFAWTAMPPSVSLDPARKDADALVRTT